MHTIINLRKEERMRIMDIYAAINDKIKEQADYRSWTALNIRDLVLER